jgi:hypothetical protein
VGNSGFDVRSLGEERLAIEVTEDWSVDSREITVKYTDRKDLDSAWKRYIKHSALATPVHPPPNSGDVATITIRTAWSAGEAVIYGTVVQATPAFTIFELAPLDPRAIMGLISMGLTEAAHLTPAGGETLAEPMATPISEAAEAEQETEDDPTDAFTIEGPAEHTVDVVLPKAPSTEPAPPPNDDAIDDSWDLSAGTFSAVASAMGEPERPRTNPRIQAGKFSPGLASPTSRPQRPVEPPLPLAPSALSSSSMTHDSDPEDPRFLAALTGPAGTDTEAALPAINRFGDLGETSWRDAVLALFLDKATGVVVLHGFREIRWGYFVDGRPVHYAGDHPHPGEYLSDFLTGDGPLSEKQWNEALRMQKLTNVPAGTYLVQRGLLTQQQLETGLIARASRITERLVAANFGRWSLHLLDSVRYAFPYRGVDVVPLLFSVERKASERMDDEKLLGEMSPFYDFHIIQVDARLHLLDGLSFRDEEQGVVDEYLSGGWTIKDLLALRAMHERPLLRLLLVLRAMGVVELAQEEGSKARRNRVERKLFVALRNITKWPSFEALHCHWTATQYEVENGYRDTLAEWDPSRFESVADDRIRDLTKQILAKAESLYATLKTRAGRDEMRKTKIDPAQRIMAADLLYKQSDMEIFKGNVGVARVLYERILELVPPNTPSGQEYRIKAKEGLANPAVASAKYPGEGFQAVFKKLDRLVAPADKD